MSLQKKVREVEKIFAELDSEIKTFQNKSALSCAAGCGKCCFKSNIEASPLEFLPFAYHAFVAGKAEELFEKARQNLDGNCMILNPFMNESDKGFCSEYVNRGLICRLFGYSTIRSNTGELKLVTCTTIKQEQSELYDQAQASLKNKSLKAPLASDYGFKLMMIDNQLGSKRFPINEAIMFSLEYVLNYYAYRNPPNKLAG